jgi:hypothetical protein
VVGLPEHLDIPRVLAVPFKDFAASSHGKLSAVPRDSEAPSLAAGLKFAKQEVSAVSKNRHCGRQNDASGIRHRHTSSPTPLVALSAMKLIEISNIDAFDGMNAAGCSLVDHAQVRS